MLRAIARNDHKWMKTDLQVGCYMITEYSGTLIMLACSKELDAKMISIPWSHI